ncbi:protein kinase [Streptomyces sp. NPDC000410]|uniref:protein kinase domain-containing protein n=1 Tax=Streptomyces sp. NPDC000410 TaxID=3154254 RepID=UPI003334A5E1
MTRQPYAVTVPEGYRVGPWIVGAPLGSGAFGSVYAARIAVPAPGLPARAALKFLSTGTHTPRQLRHLRELAEREVGVLRKLRSPRLIRMYETLTVDDPGHPELDGATVLVLEEAAGSLDALLARGRPGDRGPALLTQVCEGLRQLHRAGWVHGDLKPGNVLLMRDGTVRLGDFNMAAELEGTHAYAPAFTTADYTPPELLWSEVGERGMKIRPTADLWAFGVLAHVVLTGAQPLPGGTPSARRDAAVRYARGDEELRLSPELAEPWRQIVTDCLARTHEERERAAHDADALLRRVEAAGAGRPPRPPRRRRRAQLAVAAGVVALVGLGIGLRTLEGEEPTAHGYERCAGGAVCFFAEEDGRGDMCAWEGDDPEWLEGETRCRWAGDDGPRSVFNNGTEDPKGFVDVTYFGQPGLKQRVGCVERLEKRNLGSGTKVLSHTWARNC